MVEISSSQFLLDDQFLVPDVPDVPDVTSIYKRAFKPVTVPGWFGGCQMGLGTCNVGRRSSDYSFERQFMTTLIISSFSSGLDSAIMMMSATSVWSSMAFSPSGENRALFLSRK